MAEVSKSQSSISLLADQGIVIRKEEEQREVFVVKVPRERGAWLSVMTIERVFPQAAVTVRPKFKLHKRANLRSQNESKGQAVHWTSDR